jgi:hypothetical protein
MGIRNDSQHHGTAALMDWTRASGLLVRAFLITLLLRSIMPRSSRGCRHGTDGRQKKEAYVNVTPSLPQMSPSIANWRLEDDSDNCACKCLPACNTTVVF